MMTVHLRVGKGFFQISEGHEMMVYQGIYKLSILLYSAILSLKVPKYMLEVSRISSKTRIIGLLMVMPFSN